MLVLTIGKLISMPKYLKQKTFLYNHVHFHFLELSDGQFIGTYRLYKMLVRELLDILTPFMVSSVTNAGLCIQRKVCNK